MTPAEAWAVVGILSAGLPAGYLLVRDAWLAAALAPLMTALLAAVATTAMLVAGGSLLPWLVAALAVPCLVLTARRRPARGPAATVHPPARQPGRPIVRPARRAGCAVRFGRLVEVGCLVLPVLPPLLLALQPPGMWDAHSIWWLHAAYFSQGAGPARQAMGNPALAFSHPDYPPLASAPVAAVWAVTGDTGFRAAQVVSVLLTASAVVLLGFAVRTVTSRAPARASRLAAVVTELAVWATAPWAVASGMSDALWAAAMVAAAVLLLLGEPGPDRVRLGVFLATVAALTKNEGFVAVTGLALLVSLRERRRPGRAWPAWVPVVAGGGWLATARHLHAGSDLLTGTGLDRLRRADPALLDRLWPTLHAMAATTGPVLAVAVPVAVLGAVYLRGPRRSLGLGGDRWLWALAVGYAGSLVLTYLISPNDIGWHLATSVTRVCLPIVLLACVSAVCWAVTATTAGTARAAGTAGTARAAGTAGTARAAGTAGTVAPKPLGGPAGVREPEAVRPDPVSRP